MIFQRINRTDPERLFVVVQNNEGSALPKDSVVQMELASASIDGVKVRQPDTGCLHAVVGVCDAAIGVGEFGLVQVYGYRSSSVVFQTNTSQDTGAVLAPVAGQGYLASVATTWATNASGTLPPLIAVLGESITDSAGSATVSRKIFLKVM